MRVVLNTIFFKSTQTKKCINKMNATCNIKYNAFDKIISDLGPLIEDGYGFTLTEIREMVTTENNSVEVYNRDVKKMFIDYYGNLIRFCPTHKVNEPEMCLSADISIDDLTRKIRNKDVVMSEGKIILKIILRVF